MWLLASNRYHALPKFISRRGRFKEKQFTFPNSRAIVIPRWTKTNYSGKMMSGFSKELPLHEFLFVKATVPFYVSTMRNV